VWLAQHTLSPYPPAPATSSFSQARGA
jgi:hypothetical protein